MTPASRRPDLRRIGAVAFAEVLDTLLSLPATLRESTEDGPAAEAPEAICSRVLLTGRGLSGSVRLRLPQAFVACVVRRLTGLEADAGNTRELQDDAAGELANMVAGRVAGQLAAEGYPSELAAPSVSRGAWSAAEERNDALRARTNLICEGHDLSLEIECHYADP